MSQVGGENQSVSYLPTAIQSGRVAKQIASTVPAAPGAPKFAMDGFKEALRNGTLKSNVVSNAAVGDMLQQQSIFARWGAKIPFVRNFLGPDFILNESIGKLSKDALGGLTKAQVTKIAMEGGDIAANLAKAGLNPDAAKQIAAKGAERLAAMGGSAAATSVATSVATSAVDDIANQAVNMTMKKGFQAASSEAVKKALTSPNAIEALRDLGFYAKDAKALVAKAASSTAETAAKAATTQAAKSGATEATKSGAKGFFSKLFGGIKGNFVVAGIISLGMNAYGLYSGKLNFKQFAALTLVDTAAYGAIGAGSAAAGAAIGTALFPGVGTLAGFLIGFGLGVVGGMIYEKVVRNPLKDALGAGPAGGATPDQYDPAAYGAVPQDPYAQPTSFKPMAPAPGAELTYEEAMRQINALGNSR